MPDIIRSNVSEDDLIPSIVHYINSTNKTISLLENCTGGIALSYLATYLQDSLICGIYSPDSMPAALDSIRRSVIESKTATMKEIAQEICEAQLSKFKTDIAITITGRVGNLESEEYSTEAYVGIENTSGACKFQPIYIESKIGLSVKQQQDYIKRVMVLTLSAFIDEVYNYPTVKAWDKV